MSKFLSVKQCADYLNISTHFIYKLVEKKDLEHIRLGGKILFDESRLEAWIEAHTVEARNG